MFREGDVLGQGAFGKVIMATRPGDSHTKYALKLHKCKPKRKKNPICSEAEQAHFLKKLWQEELLQRYASAKCHTKGLAESFGAFEMIAPKRQEVR